MRGIMMSACAVVLILLVSVTVLKLSEALSGESIVIEIQTERGKSDYVLLGESANLTCHYTLDPGEQMEELQWSKDGELLYIWYPYRLPSFVKEGFVGTTQITPHTLIIPKVEMEMHGRYSCYVETDEAMGANDTRLTVIVDTCPQSPWETPMEMVSNRGMLEMNCVGMFPEPRRRCVVYSNNPAEETYKETYSFDEVTRLQDGTYEIRHKQSLTIDCLGTYEPVFVKCYMIVPGTSWRRIILDWEMKKGCSPPPLIVGLGNYSVSGGKSCWNDLQEGSVAKYYCDENYDLLGPSEFVCRNSVWVPSVEPLTDEYLEPYCDESAVSAGEAFLCRTTFLTTLTMTGVLLRTVIMAS